MNAPRTKGVSSNTVSDEIEMPDYSIVLPLYNEEENVDPCYDELTEVLTSLNDSKTWEIIYVDDGSTDQSYEKLVQLHHKDNRVKIVRFRRNSGQSAALRAGFSIAKGDIIISLDADQQNDPHDIPMMLQHLEDEDADVVVGWRKSRQDKLRKKIPSKISNFLQRKLLGLNIHDSGCTLRVYRREALKGISLFGEMHRYIPALIVMRGFRIVEVVTNHRPRLRGKTKYGTGRIFRGMVDLAYIKFWRDYSTRPMHFFGRLGLFTLFLSGLLFLYNIGLFLLTLSVGGVYGVGPTLLIAVFLFITGVQFFFFGLLSEIQVRTYYLSSKSAEYEIDERKSLGLD